MVARVHCERRDLPHGMHPRQMLARLADERVSDGSMFILCHVSDVRYVELSHIHM